MSKTIPLPKAPAHISRAINNLAALRKQVRALNKLARKYAAPILEHGSCANDKYRAHVHRTLAGMRTSYSRGSLRVRITEVKK